MKEAIHALETGALAEFGLLAFVVAFVIVVAYALTLSKRTRDELKHLPLQDLPEALPAHTTNGADA